MIVQDVSALIPQSTVTHNIVHALSRSGVAKQVRCFFDTGKLAIVNVVGSAADIAPKRRRLTKILGPAADYLVVLTAAVSLLRSSLTVVDRSDSSCAGGSLGKEHFKVLLLHLDNLRVTATLRLILVVQSVKWKLIGKCTVFVRLENPTGGHVGKNRNIFNGGNRISTGRNKNVHIDSLGTLDCSRIVVHFIKDTKVVNRFI
mmetsp:Transcript_32797/g.59396  ORF Transcript_32797/g.59396 Transcript_32797/m.59396 type:complete len:202 (+) Transcript_32797:310-915(+)